MYEAPDPLVVIAADVQDPGNLGAILRVAEAAGATGAIVSGVSADPFGWKALRGSMGSALRLALATTTDVAAAVDEARRAGCAIVATTPRDGRSVFDVKLSGATAVLVGGEGPGLAPAVVDAADIRVTIPMQSPVESLNAAVAAALVLYEVRRQRTSPMKGSGATA
jgi:TrmH family RNA methyltransferase